MADDYLTPTKSGSYILKYNNWQYILLKELLENATFNNSKDEAARDQLLVHMTGHFEGVHQSREFEDTLQAAVDAKRAE